MDSGWPGSPDHADEQLSPVALELRVHGVHNTPPTSMLGIDKSDLAQVAGDGLTGFYRSRRGELPYRKPGPGLAVEAYSWGALTSGARGFLGWVQRVLWLLLLPFALANMAYWARLGLGQGRSESRLGASAVRVASLLLTVFFVVIAATVFVDLLGWQCYRGGTAACPGMPSWFDWVGGRTPGQRLMVGALGPLLLVLVFVLLTNKTLARYESSTDPLRRDLGDRSQREVRDAQGVMEDTRPAGQVLLHPDLWNGAGRTRVLRDAHVAAALAGLVAFLGGHLLRVWQGDAGWRTLLAILVVGAVVVLVLSVLLVSSTLPGDIERQLMGKENDSRLLWARRGQVLVLVSGGLVLLVLTWLAFSPADKFDELQDFYGRNAWFVGLFIALTALHLCVFAGGRLQGALRIVVPLGVAGVLTVGCAVAYWPVWSGGNGASGSRVVIVLLVLLVVFSVLAGWHYSLARDTRLRAEAEAAGTGTASERDRTLARSAFSGAGASVLLAASAWTALLFATAAVIGAANVLNGGASVTSLETELPKRERPADVPTNDGAARPDLTVSGTVALKGAVYAVREDRLVVYSGAVRVNAAWEGDPMSTTAPLRAVPTGGRYLVETVSLPKGPVEIENSCDFSAVPPRVQLQERPGGYVCQQGGADFRHAVLLDVPSRILSINAPTAGVRLELTKPGYTPLVVPQVMVWAPLAQTLWLLLVVIAVIACVLRFGRARKVIMSDAAAYEQIPPWDRVGARRTRGGAALAHRAERILDVVGFVTSPVALALILMSSLGKAPWVQIPNIRPLANASLYVVLGAAAGLLLLGSRIRASDSVRRAVGVIWDLATFWPRAAHPFAPPCYAERIVPEISRRVLWGLSVSGTRAVVLSGHSQGSLVVAAVAARLPRLDRIRMITYGSQIRALYGRFFPAVFGPDVIGYTSTTGPALLGRAEPDLATPPAPIPVAPATSVRGRLGDVDDWTNLFRRTDPLGFRVFSDQDSEVDVATLEVPLADMGDPGPPVKGHSDYQHTPEYRRRLAEWAGEELIGHPGGTTDVLPLPPP